MGELLKFPKDAAHTQPGSFEFNPNAHKPNVLPEPDVSVQVSIHYFEPKQTLVERLWNGYQGPFFQLEVTVGEGPCHDRKYRYQRYKFKFDYEVNEQIKWEKNAVRGLGTYNGNNNTTLPNSLFILS